MKSPCFRNSLRLAFCVFLIAAIGITLNRCTKLHCESPHSQRNDLDSSTGLPQVESADSTESGYTQAVGKFPIVDTNQKEFFGESRQIGKPDTADSMYGQDAQFSGRAPSYTILDKDTVKDNNTQLIWEKRYRVLTRAQALEALREKNRNSKVQWRLPSIKEAYSLIDFNGTDPSGPRSFASEEARPFIDSSVFDFEYGADGDRPIDSQMLSATVYRGRTMGNNPTVFGVNFADGRIKGYPIVSPRGEKKFMVRFVRGNPDYGKNNFRNNGDGTISDLSTGLMWSRTDSQKGMNWPDALDYAQRMNAEKYLGHSDWRLPNAKELQSIVDYGLSPQEDQRPAINNLFNTTEIKDEDGNKNWPFYWTSTTHKNTHDGRFAVYVCFGEGLGFFAPPHSGLPGRLMDVHGAGAQRSDPKTGNPAEFPRGHGPQGDVIRIFNFVRLVRDDRP
ncbi:MAG: DUF1566 domain-containing protein [Leptospiraceae bacterium]|nr:DUF1566 domain-containing protein [Leptospiraceae bacterium]